MTRDWSITPARPLAVALSLALAVSGLVAAAPPADASVVNCAVSSGTASIEISGEAAIRLLDSGGTRVLESAGGGFSASFDSFSSTSWGSCSGGGPVTSIAVTTNNAGADTLYIDNRGTGGTFDNAPITVSGMAAGDYIRIYATASADDYVFTLNNTADLGGVSGDTDLAGFGNAILSVALLDGNDTLDAAQSTRPMAVIGGLGNDTISLGTGQGYQTYGDGFGVDTGVAGVDGGMDQIYGNTLTDQIYGGPGNDILSGGGGTDTLAGGDGDDSLSGGANDDTLTGGGGDDTLDGGGGADFMTGGDGSGDVVSYFGAICDVTVTMADDIANDGCSSDGDKVGAGVEAVRGGNGNDTLTGTAAADRLIGGPGNDTLNGGSGDDFLEGWDGADTMVGGDGIDTADYTFEPSANGGITVNLGRGTARGAASGDTFTGIENVTGTGSKDTIAGDANDNFLKGGPGNDSLKGGDGNDTLWGGTTDGGTGDTDVAVGGAGTDTCLAERFRTCEP